MRLIITGDGSIARIFVVNTDVKSIPEFPTVAVPVAALWLLVILGRRKI